VVMVWSSLRGMDAATLVGMMRKAAPPEAAPPHTVLLR
jgi:hypothetical protein